MKYRDCILSCSLVISSVLTVAGCSKADEHRGFAVPKKLCGVSVPAEAFSRLLPASGKKLTTQQDGSLEDVKICDVSVDNTTVVTVDNERIDAGDSARHLFRNRLHVINKRVMNGGDIVYSDWAAESLLKCRGRGVEKEDISVLMTIYKPGRPNESDMRKLISGYDAELRRQKPCHPIHD